MAICARFLVFTRLFLGKRLSVLDPVFRALCHCVDFFFVEAAQRFQELLDLSVCNLVSAFSIVCLRCVLGSSLV